LTEKHKCETILNSEGFKGLVLNPISTRHISIIEEKNTDNVNSLKRMKSEVVFGLTRGESVHSNNNGSLSRGIDVPKVVKGIHSSNHEESASPRAND